ncbi:MAG: tripartite tricarboxylate transporter substrate binding protein [Betaproteobacteria bacterium]|nr:tripartite tricarboxylate transporter substrate binding protein [Betaproteobacteria bacterium]
MNASGFSVVVIGAFCALPALAQSPAESYPSKPIRVIVQFQPGTSTDILARVLSQKLTEAWGKQVVVDNRPGAAAILGTELGAKSVPDGYTLVMGVSSAFGINPGLYKKLPYDAVKDFAPITNLALVAQTLVASPAFAAKTVKELVAAAQAKPGQVNYASLGSGSTSHLTMEMFRTAAGIQINHVPYKGSPAAHGELMGGNIPIMFDAMPAVLAHVKSGKLLGLAVSTAQRSTFLPELPTIAESGYPGFEATGWIGIVAPARTPQPIVARLHGQIVKTLNAPDVKERLNTLAFMPVGDTPQQFGKFIQSEIAKWTKVIDRAGIKAD